jgi:hypothetical protein
MKLLLAVSVVAVGCACTLSAVADSVAAVRSIPLDQIWAYEMQGTRNIRDLEPEKYGPDTRKLPVNEQWKLLRESLTEQIHQSLHLELVRPGSRELKKPRPAFAVEGEGREALEQACDVMAKGQEPKTTLSSDKDISVVFFSLMCGSYVRIHDVEIRENEIKIRFCFVTHRNLGMEAPFALIPLGKLEPGSYKIRIAEVAPETPGPGQEKGELHEDWRIDVICKDSAFTIANQNGQ